ncbi:MAG: response regulator transcription factor [Solirubrobacterales bacterium]|nr:response regulator transcription factor [Solirubrobacterales bacterium]
MRILVIEDEEPMLRNLERGLSRAGFRVDSATDGQTGLDKASMTAYDVIVLDRDLPRVHGDEVCRRLNLAGNEARVIMLTAAASLDDLTEGLNLGADDYLTKPFRFPELTARINALARRSGRPSPVVFERDGLTLDPSRGLAARDGEDLDLTHREIMVLEVLLRAEGGVVSADRLLEEVWGQDADPFGSSVRVTMSRLRRRLGDPPIIETVVGRGYRI